MKIKIDGGTREHLVFPQADYYLKTSESTSLDLSGCWIELTNFYAPRKLPPEGLIYVYWDRDNTTVYKDEDGTGDYIFLNTEEVTLYTIPSAEDVIKVKALPAYGDSSQIYHRTTDDTYWHFELPIEKVWDQMNGSGYEFLDAISLMSGYYWYRVNIWFTVLDAGNHHYTNDKRNIYFDNTNGYIYNYQDGVQVSKSNFMDLQYDREIHLLTMYNENPYQELGRKADNLLYKVVYYLGNKQYFWYFTVDTDRVSGAWRQISNTSIATPVHLTSLDVLLFGGDSNTVYEYDGVEYLKIGGSFGYYKKTDIISVDYPRFLPAEAAKGIVYHINNNDTYWQYGPVISLGNKSAREYGMLIDAGSAGTTYYGWYSGGSAGSSGSSAPMNGDQIETQESIPGTPATYYWKTCPRGYFRNQYFDRYAVVFRHDYNNASTAPSGVPDTPSSDDTISRNSLHPSRQCNISYYSRESQLPFGQNPREVQLYETRWVATAYDALPDPVREVFQANLPLGYETGNIQEGNGWITVTDQQWNWGAGLVPETYLKSKAQVALFLIKTVYGCNTYYNLGHTYCGGNGYSTDYNTNQGITIASGHS